MIESYHTQKEFEQKLHRQLTQIVNSGFSGYANDESGELDSETSPQQKMSLSEDAISILKSAVEGHGSVSIINMASGKMILVNGKALDMSTQRLKAKSLSAVEELISQKYIIDQSNKGQMFEVTERGYQFIESISV